MNSSGSRAYAHPRSDFDRNSAAGFGRAGGPDNDRDNCVDQCRQSDIMRNIAPKGTDMRDHSRVIMPLAAMGLLLACLGASSIDSVLKYSWGENIGWLNWRDANGTSQGVEHHGTYLSGYIWGENVGFVNVGNGSAPYANTNDTNFGVNVLGGGNLAGYAWGENIGWINFDTAAALGGFSQQARWDHAAGRFRGYAWGENIGWINLDDGSKYVAGVAIVSIAQWRSVRTHGGAGDQSITLNATATGNGLTGPTVECRSGGIQRIEIDFSSAITLATTGAITVVGQTTSYPGGVLGGPIPYTPSSVTLSGAATMVLTFPASPSVGFLPDQTCYTITIPQAAIVQTLVSDNDVKVRALVGDATGSGDVKLSDAILTKVKIGAAIATNARYDMNLDGSITNADALFAKAAVASPARKALCP
jgi:hypothetical protein